LLPSQTAIIKLAWCSAQVSGGFDEVLIVWDVRRARPVKFIPGHSDPVSGLCFSGEALDERIASCSFDGLTWVLLPTLDGVTQEASRSQLDGHPCLGGSMLWDVW
jgi:WD40 repeat protein